MEFKKIKVSFENGILTITLNSPKNLNAIDKTIMDELTYVFSENKSNEDCKVIVLKGEGRAFCAGGDIGVMIERMSNKLPIFEDELDIKPLCNLVVEMRKYPKPIIGAVRNVAAGAGFNLALACDFIIATEGTKFIQSFAQIGLVPDASGIYALTRALGPHKTLEATMLVKPLLASELKEKGLVYDVVSTDKFEESFIKLATKLAAGPTYAYGKIKKLVYESEYLGLESYLKVEEECQKRCSETEDFKEGVTAFVGKRMPQFKGK